MEEFRSKKITKKYKHVKCSLLLESLCALGILSDTQWNGARKIWQVSEVIQHACKILMDRELQADTKCKGSKQKNFINSIHTSQERKKIQGCDIYFNTCNYYLPGGEAAAPESQSSQVDQMLI